jgi:hypothetical protein
MESPPTHCTHTTGFLVPAFVRAASSPESGDLGDSSNRLRVAVCLLRAIQIATG